MNRRTFVVLSSFTLITSCSATKLSTNEISEIDSGQKVILQTYNQPLIAAIILDEQPVTKIISVDGEKVASGIFKTDEKIAIEVGTHKVEFHCTNRAGYDERDYSEVIELDLKPHHEYLVRCSFDTDFGPNGTYIGNFSVKETRIN